MINLFAAETYRYLQNKLQNLNSEFTIGEIETCKFPDGEIYHRIINPEKIRNRPAVLISGTISDAAVQKFPRGLNMRFQPVNFFANIRFCHIQNNFLRQPLLADLV